MKQIALQSNVEIESIKRIVLENVKKKFQRDYNLFGFCKLERYLGEGLSPKKKD